MNNFLNPAEILKKIKLSKGMTAADFGCGSGGWVIPLAKILEEGHVFAIDILQEPLSALRSRVKLERISNIDAMKADVEKGVSLLNESCDLVLMTNLLWQAENKKFVLTEGKRILKKGGEILAVDWQEKISPEKIKKIAGELGLKLADEFAAGSYHFGLIFKK